MNTVIILDKVTEHHFGTLYLENLDPIANDSLDYIFGGYDDFNLNRVRHSSYLPFLSKKDLKLVLHVAYLPMKIILDLSSQTIQYINNDINTYLWILVPHEYIKDLTLIINECNKHNINLEKVIVTSNNADDEYISKEGITCVGIDDWHEARYRLNVRAFSNIGYITPNEKFNTLDTATKKFICLLRNNKEHRISLYYYINKHGLSNESHVSYHCPLLLKLAGASPEGINVKLEWAVINNYLNKEDWEHAFNSKYMWKVKELDKLDQRIKDNNRKTIEPFYHDSLLSIISESQMGGVFNTEKTFKAMTHGHPFIVQGNEQMANDLKKKGYKTYENIFGVNHFYNYSETEDFLIHIKNTPHKKLLSDIKKNWNQVVYNYNHFMTRPIYMNTTINKIKKKLKRK